MRRVLCGFLALVLSCNLSVGCSLAATAAIDDEPQQAEQVQEWFCVEHQQPLIPDDEIPEGYEQICLQCNPVNRISTMAAGDETGNVPISFVSWAVPGDNLWHAAPSVIGTGGVVAYYIGQDWSSTLNSVDVRIVFSAPVSFTPSGSSSLMNPYLNLNVGVFNQEYGGDFSFLSLSGTPTGTSIYAMYSYDNSTYSTFNEFKSVTSSGNVSRLSNYRLSGFGSPVDFDTSNQIFYNFKFGGGFTNYDHAAFYVSDFGLSFGGPDDGQPGQPGTLPDDSISQSWLGGLFDTIFGGIQEIVSGIENLPQSIASGLQSLFDGVTSAVNSIGSAITGAVDSASSAITSGLTALGNFLIEGLKTLFIPSDDYFSTIADDLMSWLEEHLGLLVYPFTLVTDLASRIAAISDTEPTLIFPELSFDMDGEEYTFIEETQVNLFDQLGAEGSESRTTFETLHGYYLTLADAAIAGALALLAWRKFDQITGGAST